MQLNSIDDAVDLKVRELLRFPLNLTEFSVYFGPFEVTQMRISQCLPIRRPLPLLCLPILSSASVPYSTNSEPVDRHHELNLQAIFSLLNVFNPWIPSHIGVFKTASKVQRMALNNSSGNTKGNNAITT